MKPSDLKLASEYPSNIYLHGLHRFTIIEEPTPEPSKIPIDIHMSIRVTPDKSLRMSYTRDMTIQECRDSINRFLEFAEKEAGDNK